MASVLGTLRRLKPSWENRLYATTAGEINMPKEYGIALGLLLTIEGSPCFVASDLFAAKHTLGEVPEEIYGAEQTFTLAGCLEHGRKEAIIAFAKIVDNLRFKPESIDGLQQAAGAPPALEWSVLPGFHERQLLRRHNNALFPREKRQVSPRDLGVARNLDAAEADQISAGVGGVDQEDRRATGCKTGSRMPQAPRGAKRFATEGCLNRRQYQRAN
jgi:hypothetical protein